MITITLKKSPIRRTPEQREALRCLGLRKLNQTKQVADNPCTWGQIQKVKHLLELKK
ncbi:MAG: 50S ribosomal protein L30 [Bdellovibrionales bacterium]|nr:50S ribosomal protein L30 [Bdellovibrionales bacterium]